jgi:uncharacterized coiled-coil protein SlyX
VSNGEGIWAAIKELERRMNTTEARTAVLESRLEDLHDDINALGKKVEAKASTAELNAAVRTITDRLDRARNTSIALLAVAVPVISALVGALIRGG